MPTYEYLCKNCEWRGEFFESIKAKPQKKCPNCKKNKLQRIISKETGSNIIFLGDDWYRSIEYINQKAKENGILHTERKRKKDSL